MASEKHTIDTTDENFPADVLESNLPVLVDFWATWCGPCKAVAPVLEEIAAEFKGILKIVKVDVDKCGDTASNFGIRSIPTLLLFKNGEKVEDNIVGALPKSQIIAFLNKQGIKK